MKTLIPYMEMDIVKLPPEAMPDGEKRLLAELWRAQPALSAVTWVGALIEFNSLRDRAVHLDDVPNVALLAPGSAGRFEGAGVGAIDLLLAFRSAEESGAMSEAKALHFAESLRGDWTGNPLGMKQHVTCEFLNLADVDVLSTHWPGSTPYPDRVLGAELVAGSVALTLDLRRRVTGEMTSDKKLLKKIRDDVRSYRNTCRSGVMRFRKECFTQFSEEDGRAFYDPGESQFGFKYAFLRFFQRSLEYEVLRFVRDHGRDPSELDSLLPGFEERLRWLLRSGWILDEDAVIEAGVIYQQVTTLQTQLRDLHHRRGVRGEVGVNLEWFQWADGVVEKWWSGGIVGKG